ncbi:hypothetical protein [Sphingomonas mollis]|uniref:PAS domain-containing protein n=1 Tax=Sphingomonas mollis TaxID=2795726 RepID=A0ABS0XMI9_9SPHN|nr:hypothetical protein [Sphingomonas sp. BT553]MBJ6121240.1 hypothetical protein [Sphingomonas sp. BT553]
MKATEPLALHHSWPLIEAGQRFDLGWVHTWKATPAASADPREQQWFADRGIGMWTYDLRHDVLEWSPAVYDVMGFPRGVVACRPASLTLYREGSRAAMERLRAHAIRHRRGFTLDVELQPVGGAMRWMRLSAMPVCNGDRVVALSGVKQDISHEYA